MMTEDWGNLIFMINWGVLVGGGDTYYSMHNVVFVDQILFQVITYLTINPYNQCNLWHFHPMAAKSLQTKEK